MSTNCDILVVVAHPDDAEFGAAGSVAKWTAAGKSVVYVLCTNGDKGTSDRGITSEELSRIRQQEQREAATLLGVKEVVFLDMLDQQLEETPAFRALLTHFKAFRSKIAFCIRISKRAASAALSSRTCEATRSNWLIVGLITFAIELPQEFLPCFHCMNDHQILWAFNDTNFQNVAGKIGSSDHDHFV